MMTFNFVKNHDKMFRVPHFDFCSNLVNHAKSFIHPQAENAQSTHHALVYPRPSNE